MSLDVVPRSEDEAVAYSVEEVAERLGVHRTTIYDLMNAVPPKLASVKIGKRRLIPRASLLALLRDHSRPNQHPKAS